MFFAQIVGKHGSVSANMARKQGQSAVPDAAPTKKDYTT
jgi:hypothetical protein